MVTTHNRIVGVMGSGTSADDERCGALGRWLAGEGVHLLTGGGGGVMSAVSRAFFETEGRTGLVLGVLPAAHAGSGEAPNGYPNGWVEIPIRTHLHLSGAHGTDLASRNHVNVLSSDVLVAMPGSWGTRSEVELALRYGKPIVAYLQDRSDIPQLPEGVPVHGSFEQVKAFVRRALGR
ncbi:MAG: molybdenum cofactor carrier protein [Myxococcales bacterium]|nr:molybdenum cofactor carrier protein [Myxococcales bacterium]